MLVFTGALIFVATAFAGPGSGSQTPFSGYLKCLEAISPLSVKTSDDRDYLVKTSSQDQVLIRPGLGYADEMDEFNETMTRSLVEGYFVVTKYGSLWRPLMPLRGSNDGPAVVEDYVILPPAKPVYVRFQKSRDSSGVFHRKFEVLGKEAALDKAEDLDYLLKNSADKNIAIDDPEGTKAQQKFYKHLAKNLPIHKRSDGAPIGPDGNLTLSASYSYDADKTKDANLKYVGELLCERTEGVFGHYWKNAEEKKFTWQRKPVQKKYLDALSVCKNNLPSNNDFSCPTNKLSLKSQISSQAESIRASTKAPAKAPAPSDGGAVIPLD